MSLAAIALIVLIITILGVIAAKLSTAKRLPPDPNSTKKGINLIMSNQADPDFPAQPQYSQTTNSNSSWVNVTVTKTDANGTKTQTSHIEPRVKG